MHIHWDSLLAVLAVSFSSSIAIVVLVTVALLGLSARVAPTDLHTPRAVFSSRTGIVVAVTCTAAAAAIVLFGIWEIVSR